MATGLGFFFCAEFYRGVDSDLILWISRVVVGVSVWICVSAQRRNGAQQTRSAHCRDERGSCLPPW